jgi:hypothetical protein
MNRNVPGFPLVRAVPGFLQFQAAEALSDRTLESYRDHLACWQDYAGDPMVGQIISQDIRAFLAWLRDEYKPRRTSGATHPLS